MISRYSSDVLVKFGRGLGTHDACRKIHNGVKSGVISSDIRIVKENERLDVIAGQKYGDASLWWVIAAASGIGWGLQVPPGIVLRVPTNLDEVARFGF